MAIADYDGLKAAVASWLARSGDSSITGAAGDFITLLEARLNRWQPPLRVAEVSTTLTGTTSSRFIALPSDFREPISMHRTTNSVYEPMRPFIPGTVAYDVENGTPVAWGIDGTNVVLNCPEAQADTFDFRYRQKFALSDSDTTNYLLTNHPDVYLFGSLVEATAFMKTPAQATLWNGRFEQAMDEVTTQDARSKSIAPLVVDEALRTARTFNINTGE